MKLNDIVHVEICEVQWDEDEFDARLNGADSNTIPKRIVKDFTGYDLAADCLILANAQEGEYAVDGDAMEEFLSDWLSDTYGFCHNGFQWTYNF